MFKKLLLAAALSLLSMGSAFAACTNPLPILNGSAGSVNMSVSQNTADGGCQYNVTPMQGGAPIAAGNPLYFLYGTGATLPAYASTPTFNLGSLNGAATAAKQPALGTSGSPSTDVLTVQFPTSAPQSVSVASGGLASGAGTDGWDTTQGAKADAPCTLPATTTACSQVAIAKALANVANSPGTLSSQYPSGATAITASATGTTAATTATLAGTTGKTTYVCGYSIRANATANTNVTNTLTGVITGTMSAIMWVPANTAGLGVDEQIFSPCIPASAQNTAIAAVSGAPGTGGLVSVKAWGYQQ